MQASRKRNKKNQDGWKRIVLSYNISTQFFKNCHKHFSFSLMYKYVHNVKQKINILLFKDCTILLFITCRTFERISMFHNQSFDETCLASVGLDIYLR